MSCEHPASSTAGLGWCALCGARSQALVDDLQNRLATAERERDEAVAWQKAKQEWIEVATRTMQAQLDATAKLARAVEKARAALDAALSGAGQASTARHDDRAASTTRKHLDVSKKSP